MEMAQMGFPPPCFGSTHWLSELGMDDPLLAKSLDGAPISARRTTLNTELQAGLNGVDSTSSLVTFEPFETQKRKALSGIPQNGSTIKSTDKPIGYERLPKLTKLDTRAASNIHELGCSNVMPFLQPSTYHLGGPQHNILGQQSASIHALENFLASFPIINDDQSIAPRTPTFQFDTTYSQASGKQESSVGDVQSSMPTSGKQVPVSHSNSFYGGGNNSGFMSNNNHVMHGFNGSYAHPKSGHTQDHIIAERKRREKLSQRFIALSAIVPGLKKMDKASVLADAIKYVKHLQERLRTLEEQAPKAMSVAVQKSDRGSSTGDGIIDSNNENKQPDIEVRMVERNVLIRVNCEKKKGVLVKSLTELEKLPLAVVNANVLSFMETMLDLTFTAQVEEGSELTANDIMNTLHAFFMKLK